LFSNSFCWKALIPHLGPDFILHLSPLS
jgi:hypothetical protein